jgi:hypothetical protein
MIAVLLISGQLSILASYFIVDAGAPPRSAWKNEDTTDGLALYLSVALALWGIGCLIGAAVEAFG